jgi:hypothetical protein
MTDPLKRNLMCNKNILYIYIFYFFNDFTFLGTTFIEKINFWKTCKCTSFLTILRKNKKKLALLLQQ